MVAALSIAARMGVLIKNVADLEVVARLSAFVFDKTGTLTTGELAVTRLAPRDGVTPSALLYAAASAERFSNHPAARALVQLSGETGLALAEPAGLQEEAGRGVRAHVDGDEVLCGRAAWLHDHGVQDASLDAAEQADTEGLSLIFVARGGKYLGWVGLEDRPRPEAAAAIDALHGLSIRRIAMVTGDRTSVASAVAREVHCPEFRAECLPQQKVEFVEQVRRDGYRVAFVGDGVNDAPALAASDTGIAMGAAGSDIAIHSATIALMSNDLNRIPFLVRLAHSARRVIYQNFGVGLLFILGGLVLTGLGLLSPIVAALLHNAGSLIVVFNSARLVRAGEGLEPPAQPISLTTP